MKEPRFAGDYAARQTKAARRVLVDVQQVLAGFRNSVVVVGGWVPDLLLPEAVEPHVGSIDVDLALDVEKLEDGRYAELLGLLIGTGRYRLGPKPFQLHTIVQLEDGRAPVTIEVDFLATRELPLRGKHLIKGFRVQQADGCSFAFRAPEIIEVSGQMIDGAGNTVLVRVVSLADFLVMKCYALAGRDKPKDAYDIVFCLDHVSGGRETVAAVWRTSTGGHDFNESIRILREKFSDIGSFGPQRAAQFLDLSSPEERDIAARRAYELVQDFLRLCDPGK